MPDDEGFLLPGELGVGSYAAGEMDLGERLRPFLGFSGPSEGVSDDEASGPVSWPTAFTTGPSGWFTLGSDGPWWEVEL